MFDFVPDDRATNGLGVFLVVKLRRVAANDDQLVRILLFEILQVGQDMNAVDAAVGPEVDQDDLSPQILQRDFAGRVEPRFSAIKAGSREAVRKRILQRLAIGADDRVF